jgi:hypothetical protein
MVQLESGFSLCPLGKKLLMMKPWQTPLNKTPSQGGKEE